MIPQISNNKDDKMAKLEKQEITDATFKIQPDIFSLAENTQQVDTDKAADLDRQLTKSSEPFSATRITSIKKLFFEIGLRFITAEQVRQFLNRLPKIEHLDYNKHTFEILQFLSEDPKFAELIFSSQVLEDIDFSTFEIVDDQIKTSISDMILNIVEADPEYINSFISNFFPYFYHNMQSKNFYANGGLSTHLQLASKFICSIEDQHQIDFIFSRFTLFINHTSSSVVSQSFYGLIVSINKHKRLLRNQEFLTDRFINRLTFIGRQKNRLTGPLVFIVFQHLLNTNFKYTKKLYLSINDLIIRYLTPDASHEEEETMNPDETDSDAVNLRNLDEAISLIPYAFSNASFVESICSDEDEHQLDMLMNSFLEGYNMFRLSEKKESAYVFANFFYFLPLSIIQRYAKYELFFECLIDIMDIDEPNVLQVILNGINRPLGAKKDLFTLEQKSVFADSLITITQSEDETLAHSAQIILKALED